MSKPAIAWLRSRADLAAFEPRWRTLYESCPGLTPFSSPDWLIPWWQAFEPGTLASPAVVADGRCLALAPIYEERGPKGRRLLPLGIGISDLGDILVAPGHADEALPLLAGAIGGLGLPVLWTGLPADSLAHRLLAPPGWQREAGDGEACPVLSLEDATLGPDGWPDRLPAGRRRKLRMAQHRLAARSGVRFRGLGEIGPDAFLDALEHLHGLRWQVRGEAGVLADSSVRRFHRLALPRLAAAGLAEGEVLEIEGRPAAAYYGLRDGREAMAYLGGFDPAFARESPGAILMGRAVARAVEAGCRRFNWLRGREDYKYGWGAADEPTHWLLWQPPRVP